MSFSNNKLFTNSEVISNIDINHTKLEIQNAIEKLIDSKLEQKLNGSNTNSPILGHNNTVQENINNTGDNNIYNNFNFVKPKQNIMNDNKIINIKNYHLIHLDTLFQKHNLKNKNLILTNIDLDTDNVKLLIRKYRNDYLEQRLYFDNNFKESARWTDTPENDSLINDVFAFVNPLQNKVELFRIENILQNYLNIETKNKYELSKDYKLRRTLILSKKIMEITWLNLKEYLDYSYNFTFKGMIKCYRKI